MDLAAEGFAAQSVAKLVNHLHHGQSHPHVGEILGGKGREVPKREEIAGIGQLVQKGVEVRRHQQDRPQHDPDAEQQKGDRENPPGVRHHAG